MTNEREANEILVSVVVPTRNRREMLRDCLDGLLSMNFDPHKYEVIVVDNISTDGTAEMVSELASTAKCAVRFHVMPVNRGPAPSRNQGARMARGSIIAFTDSDCRPHPDWLANAVAGFDDDVAFVTGTVLNKPNQRPRFFSKCLPEMDLENITYPTANACYRKTVYWEFGGMEEGLCFPDVRGLAVECADTDLAWRIKSKGYRNRFVPSAIIYHEVEDLTFLEWMAFPLRLFVVPALVGRHAELRVRLMHHRYVLFPENAWFVLAVVGVALGLLVSPWFYALALPYLRYLVGLLSHNFRLSGIPKLVPQAVLVVVRQFLMMVALFYGSARFRTLVL